MSAFLYRIRPPRTFTHELEGMTGRIVGAESGYYLLALTCRSDIVRIPRSWLTPVPPGPLTAAEARGQSPS